MDQIPAIVELLASAVISEATAVMFLVAAAVFLVGVIFMILFALSRTFGYRTRGSVVGAVERTRIKQKTRDGKTIEKTRKSLVPVFEYTARAGDLRQMLASEGGSATLKYTTGQVINLIVREDQDYDDVYDADRYGALYVGLVLAGLGIALMVFVGSAAAAFGIGTLFLVVLSLAYLVRALVLKGSGAEPASTVSSAGTNKSAADRKAFVASDVQPIEYFQRQASLNKTP